ncbi:hypothetical protein JRO89_XS03G0021300 [Xanthoceras sorbifolium]|uniref:Uncharacterized protein n=1 Tax=Xanthoceras sorbifolium TaxID=99658 RepID=A0ABQ8I957_9ROSI|nr:hypothetical protein JRO89_XS03G0021300 [Xanthoceras sorbifolium]
MQLQNPVQILSKKLIKPASPTPHHLHKFKISSLDQFNPPLYVSYILCYPAIDKGHAKAKNLERNTQLQRSLSQVLALYYPLAGRYVKENLLIHCNDLGVEYIEAKVSGRLSPLVQADADSCWQLKHFIPVQFESPSSPLLAVQCNMFECGGVAIALSISHRIVDGFVFSKFIDSWATTSRAGIDKVCHHPNFKLASVLPTMEMVPEIMHLPPFNPQLKIASKTFVFKNLEASLPKEVLKRQPSRVQMVTAVIWKALMKVSQVRHGKLRPSVIIHMLNLRGRTALPISDDYCGNLVRPAIIRFTPDKESRMELRNMVSLLGNEINFAVNECAKPQTSDDLFYMVYNAWKNAVEAFGRGEADAYFYTSICGMPLYPDFGWEKPVRVIHTQSLVEMIVLQDTRDEDGIEARICLDENVMSLFEQDPDIIAFTSQNCSKHLLSGL